MSSFFAWILDTPVYAIVIILLLAELTRRVGNIDARLQQRFGRDL